MKVEVYERLTAAQVSRRKLLQGTAGVGALAAASAAGLGASLSPNQLTSLG